MTPLLDGEKQKAMNMTKLETAARLYAGIEPYYGDLESRAFIAGANWALEEEGLCLWIPITERLPDNTIESCEVTYNYVDSRWHNYEPEKRRVAPATYKDGEFEVHTNVGSFKTSHAGSGVINLFAWRPSPKPFDGNY